ncbi:MAG: NYN domain-containing protein [Patescibacteria group bacterium]|nr:NYN domain-containing protein [Patescibacteria group bacterium]
MSRRVKRKSEKIYAFIDSQNLNLGTSKSIYKKRKLIYKGWRLDYRKFLTYLSDKFRVDKALLFIGFIPSNKKLYSSLKRWGYEIVYKPTVKDGYGKPKGNVDAELVLHSARLEYDNYDKAVIVSGDGDFHCLHKFLKEMHKLKAIIIPNKFSESSLLKEFQNLKVFLYREKSKLELR